MEKKIIDGYELARTIARTGVENQNSTACMVAGFIHGFIKEAPEAVVTCKDCILLDTPKCPMKSRVFPNGDFFCASGKKGKDN